MFEKKTNLEDYWYYNYSEKNNSRYLVKETEPPSGLEGSEEESYSEWRSPECGGPC